MNVTREEVIVAMNGWRAKQIKAIRDAENQVDERMVSLCDLSADHAACAVASIRRWLREDGEGDA